MNAAGYSIGNTCLMVWKCFLNSLARRPMAPLRLAAKFRRVDTLAGIPHQGMVVRIGNCDVVAGVWKVIGQLFHVGHGSLRSQALNNVMGRLSHNWSIKGARGQKRTHRD